jgi:micrococcal nuclease
MFEYKVLEVSRVVDGDTVDVVIDLGFSVSIKERIRILGIDSEELNSTVPEQRAKAFAAKEFASKWFLQDLGERQLTVKTYKDKSDKYGRILGDFRFADEPLSFSEAILEAGLAKVY